MKKTSIDITTLRLEELTPAAHKQALQRIAQIIQHTWATDPGVQQLVGLRPESTESDAKAAQPRVHGWVRGMQVKLEAQLEFLPSGEPFDVKLFSKAVIFVPPEEPEPSKVLAPVKTLVDPLGRPLKTT